MSKIKVGDVYIVHTYLNGEKELAKVIEIEGVVFKKYKCMVWGIRGDGSHHWPNGSVSHYENYLSKQDLTRRWSDQ